jgi:hypothetical protein
LLAVAGLAACSGPGTSASPGALSEASTNHSLGGTAAAASLQSIVPESSSARALRFEGVGGRLIFPKVGALPGNVGYAANSYGDHEVKGMQTANNGATAGYPSPAGTIDWSDVVTLDSTVPVKFDKATLFGRVSDLPANAGETLSVYVFDGTTFTLVQTQKLGPPIKGEVKFTSPYEDGTQFTGVTELVLSH